MPNEAEIHPTLKWSHVAESSGPKQAQIVQCMSSFSYLLYFKTKSDDLYSNMYSIENQAESLR